MSETITEDNQKQKNESNSGCIYRCPHDNENPFTIISNSLLRNSDLSFEALGLLSFLLSHSFQWKTSRAAIGKQRKIGEHKLKRIFDELIDHGYVNMTFTNGKNGHRQVNYLFSESNKFKKIVPHLDFPGLDFPCPVSPGAKEEQVLRSTNINTTTTTIDNTCDMETSSEAVVGSSSPNSSKAREEFSKPLPKTTTPPPAVAGSPSQLPTDSKAETIVDTLMEKVDKKFDKYILSEARKAIHVALQTYSEEVVACSIEELNVKDPQSILSVKGLFPVICNKNHLKGSTRVADTALLEKRKTIAKCLEKMSTISGGHTFDDKKLYVHSGATTKEYTYTGNDSFWDKMEEVVRLHVKTSR